MTQYLKARKTGNGRYTIEYIGTSNVAGYYDSETKILSIQINGQTKQFVCNTLKLAKETIIQNRY